MLVHEIDDKATFAITEKAPNLFTIQIPRINEKPEGGELTKAQKKFIRLQRFQYDFKKTEE